MMVRLAAVSATPRFFRTAIVVALLASGSMWSHASATVVRQLDFDAQCRAADRIFVGTVRAVEARPNSRAPHYFETFVTFTVDEAIAGRVPAALHLRLSGGTVGDERQSIDGMPDFAVGERYVVMLEADQDPPLVSPILGFNQGLYRVVTDAGDHTLVRDRSGRPLRDFTSAASARVAPRAAAVAEPELATFVAMIRAARGR
jgi:hypothetical protein